MSLIFLDTVGRHDKQVKLPCGLDTVQPPLEGIQTNPFAVNCWWEDFLRNLCSFTFSVSFKLWRSHNSRIDDLINYFWKKKTKTIWTLGWKSASRHNIIKFHEFLYLNCELCIAPFDLLLSTFVLLSAIMLCHQLLSIWVSFSLYITLVRNKISKCLRECESCCCCSSATAVADITLTSRLCLGIRQSSEERR